MILRRFAKQSDGSTAVEFGLTAPVFLAALFGVIELGMLFWTQLGLQHAAELTARDDSLTKKQINELRQLFPDTPLSGILQSIAEFNRLGLRDPMAAAGKLAFAFGAPRTEAELNEWSAREAQRGQQHGIPRPGTSAA